VGALVAQRRRPIGRRSGQMFACTPRITVDTKKKMEKGNRNGCELT